MAAFKWQPKAHWGAIAWVLLACTGATADDPDRLLDPFWAAPTAADRDAASHAIIAGGATYDEVASLLREGRSYSDNVPRGMILRERIGVGGVRHPYAILVPEGYTPARRWPVRFELHGGMGAKEWKDLDGSWTGGWTRSVDWIIVFPAGWWGSMWWEWSQAENADAILREVRATWNIDENRVVLNGVSDGGAAVFWNAMRTPDRYAGFAGSVAPPDRLVRADFRPDGQSHVSNLSGQRFHLDYGGVDEKVPLKYVEKYMALFEDRGANIDWKVQPGQGHGLSLPEPRLQALIDFLVLTTRDPLPNSLSWATERTDRYARRSWLVIDQLEAPGKGHVVDESNLLPRWGTPIQVRGPTIPRVPWGRVEIAREGNRVRATTRRIERFRILISPDEFDLGEPVVVEVDGKVAFDGKVQPSLATLLYWAAIDDDRTKLFAAEITIEP